MFIVAVCDLFDLFICHVVQRRARCYQFWLVFGWVALLFSAVAFCLDEDFTLGWGE